MSSQLLRSEHIPPEVLNGIDGEGSCGSLDTVDIQHGVARGGQPPSAGRPAQGPDRLGIPTVALQPSGGFEIQCISGVQDPDAPDSRRDG